MITQVDGYRLKRYGPVEPSDVGCYMMLRDGKMMQIEHAYVKIFRFQYAIYEKVPSPEPGDRVRCWDDGYPDKEEGKLLCKSETAVRPYVVEDDDGYIATWDHIEKL